MGLNLGRQEKLRRSSRQMLLAALVLASAFSFYTSAMEAGVRESENFVSVCDRSSSVRGKLENWFQLNCSEIGQHQLDLMDVSLSISIDLRKDDNLFVKDFAGMKKLKTLKITVFDSYNLELNRSTAKDRPRNLIDEPIKKIERLEINRGVFLGLSMLKQIRFDLHESAISNPAIFVEDGAFSDLPNIRLVLFGSRKIDVNGNRAAFIGVPEVSGLNSSFGLAESVGDEW